MYLGIDIGTSGVKAVLIDEHQTIRASANAALTVSRPHTGWSEQDPEDWWQAALAVIDAIHAEHPGLCLDIRAIGLSGQMHGATLLDHDGAVLRPAILWNDGRAAAECVELEERADFRGIGGNIVMPGFTAPKLRWVEKHEPDLFAQIATVLLPKDYVRYRLTGSYVSDMSDSAGTLWMDVAARDWSDELLAATHLTRAQMPRLVEGSAPGGVLADDLSERWGIGEEVVIAGGGGDNAASACGIGAVTPGSAFASIGTSGVLFVSNPRFSPNTDSAVHAFCHAVPDTWHQMGVILSAADSLEWLARLLDTRPAALTRALGDRVSGPAPVTFLPYLSGERTPHNDATPRGAFVGLAQTSDRAALAHAVLDGVAFAFRDCLGALEAAGTSVDRAFAIGGGANSALWLTIVASVLNRPLDIPAAGDFGAAFGAARLGMCAAEGADPATVCTPPPIARTVEPDPALTSLYAERYGAFKALYPAIKEAMTV